MDLVPGERERGPKKIGALADAAFAAYGRNAGFYLLAALVLALIQAAVSALTHDLVILTVLNALADALLIGIVAIGTMSTIAGSNPSPRAILGLGAERLWSLFALQLVAVFAQPIAYELMVGESASESLGLTTAVMIYVWGLLQLPVVIAAIEEPLPNPIFGALVRTATSGMRLHAIARVTLLGLVTIPAAFLQVVVDDYLRRHGMAVASPAVLGAVDTLLTGPYAAFVTVFYLDLRRRERT